MRFTLPVLRFPRSYHPISQCISGMMRCIINARARVPTNVRENLFEKDMDLKSGDESVNIFEILYMRGLRILCIRFSLYTENVHMMRNKDVIK